VAKDLSSADIQVSVQVGQPRELQTFVKWQNDLDRVSMLRDLKSSIEILRVNELEKGDKKIYQGRLTVVEVARKVFDALTAEDGATTPEIREML
jgi:glutamyl-tRNA reductase